MSQPDNTAEVAKMIADIRAELERRRKADPTIDARVDEIREWLGGPSRKNVAST